MNLKKLRFNIQARTRSLTGAEPVAANMISASTVPLTFHVKHHSGAVTADQADATFHALQEKNGLWTIQVSGDLRFGAIEALLILQHGPNALPRNLKLEDAVTYLADKEFQHYAAKNIGCDFVTYLRNRGLQEESWHITNALLRLEKAGQIDLHRLAERFTGLSARKLHRLRSPGGTRP